MQAEEWKCRCVQGRTIIGHNLIMYRGGGGGGGGGGGVTVIQCTQQALNIVEE